MISNLNDICDCCGGDSQPILQLFNDKCFKVVDGKDTRENFCLTDFAFPTDGESCVNLTGTIDGGTVSIFDNSVIPASPVQLLDSGKLYARGILIKVTYPANDNNSEEILIANKSVRLIIERADTLELTEYPLYNFFAMFTNPKSNDPSELINKIEIVNPNTDYPVRVSALVVYGLAE
jgi:hypothetical protein